MMTAEQLLAHTDSGELWPREAGAPLFTDLDAAYQTALAVRRLRQARGDMARGYKIGFTNRSIWERYRVFAPIWGTVWDRTLSQTDEAATLSLAHLCQPRLEPEVVFGLRATPPPNADLASLYDAIDWVAPGFEIVQSHCPDWRFSAAETVADGGLHGRLLIGRHVPLVGLVRDADSLVQFLATATVGLQRGGADVESGVGANVLDSPLHALLHFVNELRACPGAPDLQAGDVVTTGTWTDAWPVQRGERWRADFGGRLPALEIAFSA
ncbi:MAG: hydratase [Pseudomonadota bacterium]|nr:hydratase [Pseudomonadota bacterium]